MDHIIQHNVMIQKLIAWLITYWFGSKPINWDHIWALMEVEVSSKNELYKCEVFIQSKIWVVWHTFHVCKMRMASSTKIDVYELEFSAKYNITRYWFDRAMTDPEEFYMRPVLKNVWLTISRNSWFHNFACCKEVPVHINKCISCICIVLRSLLFNGMFDIDA